MNVLIMKCTKLDIPPFVYLRCMLHFSWVLRKAHIEEILLDPKEELFLLGSFSLEWVAVYEYGHLTILSQYNISFFKVVF